MNTDRRQFDEAFVELFVLAERTARRILGDTKLAEDIAAETTARALMSWSRIAAYATAWTTRVATNLALDETRRKPVVFDREGLISLEDAVVARVIVVDGLRHLTRRQREAISLRYLVGLTEDEAAVVLGISRDTVKTHIRRGLLKLRQHIDHTPTEVPVVPHRSA